VTQEYRVEGPVMIVLTTTAIEIDEELLNRCLVLTVDESREQTRRIHELQREEETIEGHLRKRRAARLRKLHQNAQRLLKTIPAHNRFAQKLTFPDENTRLRRDQLKYLTLMRANAFLHQYQRPRRVIEGVEHIEVTLEDVAAANRLVADVLGRTLDEMSPQTRRFLDLLHEMAGKACRREKLETRHYRFIQREARDSTGWSSMQVKRHMAKLAELEYVYLHRSGRGQQFVYELVYNGEGRDGSKFLVGLIDVEKLRSGMEDDDHRGGQKGRWGGEKAEWGLSGAPLGHGWGIGGAVSSNGDFPSENPAKTAVEGENAYHGQKKEMGNGGRNPSSDLPSHAEPAR
jgi:hypothetical protein